MRKTLTYFPRQHKLQERNETKKSRISGKGRERISSVFNTVNKKVEENWILRQNRKRMEEKQL